MNEASERLSGEVEPYAVFCERMFGTPFEVVTDGLSTAYLCSLAGDDRRYAIDRLIEGVGRRDWMAARALCDMGAREAVAAIDEALEGAPADEASVRMVEARRDLSGVAADPALHIALLCSDRHWGERVVAATGLREFRERCVRERVVSALLDALVDDAGAVRAEALASLSTLLELPTEATRELRVALGHCEQVSARDASFCELRRLADALRAHIAASRP